MPVQRSGFYFPIAVDSWAVHGSVIRSVRRNTKALLQQIQIDGKTPLLGLYIDCAGRAAAIFETLTEEAAEVQTLFTLTNIPLFGFYSGVEIAPLLGKSQGLDWTGVLLVFTTRNA
jgi:small ligand-binding sensory domain FIST